MDCNTDPAALFEQGNILLGQGRAQDAVAVFQHCHRLRPEHAGILYNLGNAQLSAGKLPDAADALVACLRRAPDFGPGYVNLADTLRRLTLLDPALTMAQTGLALLPGQTEALITLANVLHDRADYAGAAELYRKVLAVEPDRAGALTNLANTYRIMGRLPEALAIHHRAVALAPENAEIRFNRALAYLMHGDYRQGWREYEFRWQQPQARPRRFGTGWEGECIAGRTLLLHAEQGLGDTLQFIRYVPLLSDRGARLVVEVQPELLRLVRRAMPFATVLARGDDLPAFDAHCPLLSLPRVLGTELDRIPAALPYLSADPDLAAAWRRRLPQQRPLVGLVWAGGTHMNDAGAHLIDRRRSLQVADVAQLSGIAGIHWVNLQKGRAEQPMPMLDLMDEVADFADTAALVANLDLVVSVDTSVAHLAGAMGRPVWLLSRYDGCWRWLHDRSDSPWYPGMRLYRQERPLDWSAMIRQVRSDLAATFQ
jgi:tetratricopeptide (TPR) repeat protein